MKPKWWGLLAAAVVLGGFLVLKHLERSTEVPVLPPSPLPATTPGAPPTPPAVPPQATVPPLPPPVVQAPDEATRLKDVESCRRFTDLETMLKSLEPPTPVPGVNPDALRPGVARAYLCEALAAADPQRCLAHPAFPGGPKAATPARTCWELYPHIHLLELATREEVVRACESNGHVRENYSETNLHEACGLYSALLLDAMPVAQAAERLTALSKAGAGDKRYRADVERLFVFLKGPQACASMKGPEWAKLFCEDRAYLRTALPAHNPDLCGPSALCRAAITRAPAACQVLREAAVASYCRMAAEGFAAFEAQRRGRDAKLAAEQLRAQEDSFRKANRLPAWKKGDPFLNTLPEAERKKYEWNPALKKPKPPER